MKRLISTALILGTLVGHCIGNQNDPVFAIIEHYPWAIRLGIDTPSFVLYEDGTIYYLRKDKDQSYIYYTCNISSNKALISELDLKNRADLKDNYYITTWDDDTTTVFFWKDKKIEVYGDILDPTPSAYERKVKPESCPVELAELLKTTRSFENQDARKWMPEMIELKFYPWEKASGESTIWPAKWPDLEDPNTRERRYGSYSVYIPSEEYDALKTFLQTKGKNSAILINGKKMCASIRFPFPGEEQWIK